MVTPAPRAKSGSGIGVFLGLAAAALLLVGGGGLGLWLMRDKLPFLGGSSAETAQPEVQPASPSPEGPGSEAVPPPTADGGATPAAAPGTSPGGVPALRPPEPRGTEGRATPRTAQDAPPAPRGAEPPPQQPAPAASSDPFAQENLRKLSAPERMAMSNQTMSEATALSDSDPGRSIELLRRAIAANPGNERAYAWLLVVLYRQERFAEFQSVADMARRNGVSFQRMMSNARFRSVIQDERLNRRLPGGLRGLNED
jgi:hypothetical protein